MWSDLQQSYKADKTETFMTFQVFIEILKIETDNEKDKWDTRFLITIYYLVVEKKVE